MNNKNRLEAGVWRLLFKSKLYMFWLLRWLVWNPIWGLLGAPRLNVAHMRRDGSSSPDRQISAKPPIRKDEAHDLALRGEKKKNWMQRIPGQCHASTLTCFKISVSHALFSSSRGVAPPTPTPLFFSSSTQCSRCQSPSRSTHSWRVSHAASCLFIPTLFVFFLLGHCKLPFAIVWCGAANLFLEAGPPLPPFQFWNGYFPTGDHL